MYRLGYWDYKAKLLILVGVLPEDVGDIFGLGKGATW
jgi:hypothetical protein